MGLLRMATTTILPVLHRSLLPAAMLTFLASFFYLYCVDPADAGRGLRTALAGWARRVKTSSFFRRLLLLMFYSSVILFGTVLSRGQGANPFSSVMGGWRLWSTASDGSRVLGTNFVVNLLMLAPLPILLLWTFGEGITTATGTWAVVRWSAVVAFAASLAIETLQLVLRVGNWQFADLVYNTLGGVLGGLAYCALRAAMARNREQL